MLSSTEKKKPGMTSLIIALALIGTLGFGLGIGIRIAFDQPGAENVQLADAGSEDPGKTKSATKDGSHDEAEAQAHSGGPESAESDSKLVAAEEIRVENLSELIITPIDPVLTNLGNPKNVWVRMEGVILSRTDAEVPAKILASQASQQIMSYLRTVDTSQMEGASGLHHITEDLNEVMRAFSGGEVRQLLITALILE